MTAEPPRSTASLTGAWQGFYTYDYGRKRTEFSATLEQSGNALSGVIEEYSDEPDGVGRVHFARVEGRTADRAVLFSKTYTGLAGWMHTVDYEAEVDDERNRISGTWRFSATSVGVFEMRRVSPAKRSTAPLSESPP